MLIILHLMPGSVFVINFKVKLHFYQFFMLFHAHFLPHFSDPMLTSACEASSPFNYI